jgi:hypothetical protein
MLLLLLFCCPSLLRSESGETDETDAFDNETTDEEIEISLNDLG